MSVQGIMEWTVDIDKPAKPVHLGPIFEGDQDEFKVSLHLLQNGQPVSLTGAAVIAYMRRADRTTVVWSGSVSSNIASVVLTQHVHTIPGRVQLVVRVTIGTIKHTVFSAEGDVLRSTTDAIVDPTGVIPSLDDLFAQISRMEQATTAAEAVAENVEGMINSAVGPVSDDVSVLKNTIAQIDGILNGGEITTDPDVHTSKNLFNPNDPDFLDSTTIDRLGITSTSATLDVTGFIPCARGDTFTFTSDGAYLPSTNRTFVYYNADKSYRNGYSAGSMPTHTIIEDAAYFRTVLKKTELTKLMIVKNDTSIPEYEEYGQISTGGDVTDYGAGVVAQVNGLIQTMDATKRTVNELQETVGTLESGFDARVTGLLGGKTETFTVGQNGGYFAGSVGSAVTERSSSAWTRSKIERTDSMLYLNCTIKSVNNFSYGTLYFAFADENDILIYKNPFAVGDYHVLIPDNAKYIYLSFFGDPWVDSYSIEHITYVTNKELDKLHLDNPYEGMKGVAFGTSLTYRAQTTGGYLQYLPGISGIEFDNQGVGSSKVYGGATDSILNKVLTYGAFADKDVCTIEGFVNDWYGSSPLGVYTDTDTTTVCGCIRTAIAHVMAQNPNITLFVVLDHYGRNYNSVDCSTSAARNGKTQYQYYEECAKVCESMGVPCIKGYAVSRISELTPQYFIDNIHLNNAKGAEQSAKTIWNEMRKYAPNVR